MADEEKPYEVRDKRKVKLNKDGEVEVTETPESPAPEAEKGDQKKPEEEQTPEQTYEEMGLPPVDVYALIKSFMSILSAQVWQWLGLLKNPATGQLEKDLTQAKVAIDTISLLISQIESKLDPSELRELRGMISDLRMNYVRQSSTPPSSD